MRLPTPVNPTGPNRPLNPLWTHSPPLNPLWTPSEPPLSISLNCLDPLPAVQAVYLTWTDPWPSEKQRLIPVYYSRMFVPQNLTIYYVYLVPKGDTVPPHNFDLSRSFWLSSGYHHTSDWSTTGHVVSIRFTDWFPWSRGSGHARGRPFEIPWSD